MCWYQRNRRCDIGRKDKKKEQPRQKEKEFAAAPFKALKGVHLAPPPSQEGAAAAPKKPEKPAKPKEELDDLALFFEAVADIKPLQGAKAPPPKGGAPAPEKRGVSEEENRIFLQAVEALRMDVRFSDGALEEDEGRQRPVAVNRLRQLRRGGIRIDLQLDLHGLTRDEALENLAPFIVRAHARGQKGVLVITGKGNNSNGEPVLRQAVAGWLREHGKGMVSEFAEAPREMGGSGAFVVFLKEKKEEP
ncbi:Smr/MutS family protein [Geomonas sp. RF6]|uniref:Smr/MutS family protein n=1 Tax=Geomonas sp. RF6 TaxID=2897342 RepID=UPI001E57BFE8|nr:Smr/MutS family protein [Geomonas sp. RF6]UFS72635.1 Smr/MutS family protein [Geomonas sp. RF6]